MLQIYICQTEKTTVKYIGFSSIYQSQQAQAILHALQQSEGGVNHVIRVVVENMIYPITVEILHKIFAKFGTVLKVITFNKNG